SRCKLDILTALSSGIIELVESGTNRVLSFGVHLSERHLDLTIPPKPTRWPYHGRVALETDTTSEVWKATLRPNHTYDLRLPQGKGEAWCYYNDTHPGRPSEVPLSERMPVAREIGTTVSFTVYDDPAPPQLLATLRLEPQVCHISGYPPFQIIIEFTTDSKQIVTFDKSRTPLSSFWLDSHGVEELIDCVDESGEEVEWPAQFGCFDSDPRPEFPDDSDFVEISSDRTWRFVYILKKESQSNVGGLEDLRAGKMSRATIAGDLVRKFPKWLYGQKEDLLKGTLEEKKRRWGFDTQKRGSMEVKVGGEPMEFQVV
ncbi:hypothetical protein K491DRAFT_601341, partial [Lophiostoma macrostomum CBS 122681]